MLSQDARDIVAALNAQLGTKLDDADTFFFQTVLHVATQDQVIRLAAEAGPEVFTAALRAQLPNILQRVIEGQRMLHMRLLTDDALRREAMRGLCEVVYTEARASE